MSAQMFAASNAKLVSPISLRADLFGNQPRILGTYLACLSFCLSRGRNTASCIM